MLYIQLFVFIGCLQEVSGLTRIEALLFVLETKGVFQERLNIEFEWY